MARRLVLLPLLGLALLAALAVGVALAAFSDTFSNPSNAFNTDTLDPPTALTASGNGSITLNWTATADTYASGYRILRGTASGGPYSQIAEVTPRTTTSYADSPAAGTYFYVARSFFQSWESANSNEASGTVSTTVSFGADADAKVKEVDDEENFGTAQNMTARSLSAAHHRSLVRFDISSIPAGSTVSSATLTLCVIETPSASAIGSIHEVRRVTGSWGETTVTWNNQPSVSGTATGTITVPGSASCVSVAVTSDVQAWVNGTPNNGWRVSNQDEGIDRTRYGTRENGTAGNRPLLEVTYTPP